MSTHPEPNSIPGEGGLYAGWLDTDGVTRVSPDELREQVPPEVNATIWDPAELVAEVKAFRDGASTLETGHLATVTKWVQKSHRGGADRMTLTRPPEWSGPEFIDAGTGRLIGAPRLRGEPLSPVRAPSKPATKWVQKSHRGGADRMTLTRPPEWSGPEFIDAGTGRLIGAPRLRGEPLSPVRAPSKPAPDPLAMARWQIRTGAVVIAVCVALILLIAWWNRPLKVPTEAPNAPRPPVTAPPSTVPRPDDPARLV